MKKLFLILALLSVVSANAQFTKPNQVLKRPEIKDTLIKNSNSAPMTIDMQLYNAAYDAYLKKLQTKQRTQWIIKNTGVAFTQTAFDNWATGGNNSYSVRGAVNITHRYVAPVFNITNSLDGALSLLYSENKLTKSEDYFNISVTPSWKVAKCWEVSSSLVIRSQFANSFKEEKTSDTTRSYTKTSSFFAPGVVTLSAGITYVSKNGKLKIYTAPISGNMTIILDRELAERGGLGLPAGDQFGNTFGAFMRINYSSDFAKKRMNYTTKLESFWGYQDLPNFTFENWLSFKFTNLLSANLYLKAYYNEKVQTPRFIAGDRGFFSGLQIQETFTFGLSYNFTGKKPDPSPVVSNNKYLKASPKKKGRRVEQ